METLPFIDEHCRPIDASAEVVWGALVSMLRRLSRRSSFLARLLSCDPLEGTADFAGRPGEAVPGFRVTEAEPGRRLVLRGRHRFALYSLTFVIEGGQLKAITHADFPGLLGRLYRAAVIGSGAHAVVTRLMLRQVDRECRAVARS